MELANRESQSSWKEFLLRLKELNEEIRRRTRVVRIFPNREWCLRLIRALCVETHEGWLEASRYLNMSLLTEHKRELLKSAAHIDVHNSDLRRPMLIPQRNAD